MRAVLQINHTTDKVKAKDKRSFARSQRRWKMMNFCLVFITAIISYSSMGAVVKSALGARGVVFGGGGGGWKPNNNDYIEYASGLNTGLDVTGDLVMGIEFANVAQTKSYNAWCYADNRGIVQWNLQAAYIYTWGCRIHIIGTKNTVLYTVNLGEGIWGTIVFGAKIGYKNGVKVYEYPENDIVDTYHHGIRVNGKSGEYSNRIKWIRFAASYADYAAGRFLKDYHARKYADDDFGWYDLVNDEYIKVNGTWGSITH